MKIFFPIFILILSCTNKSEHSSLFQKLNETWPYSVKLEVVADEINSGQVIERPPGIPRELLRVFFSNREGECLFYKVPLKEEAGHLWVTSLKSGVCSEDEIQEKLLANNLKITLSDVGDLRKLKFTWRIDSDHHEESVTFYNLAQLNLRKNEIVALESKLLGTTEDSYPDRTLIPCLQFDESCHPIGENRCSLCRHGAFEVVTSKCRSKGDFYCGPNRCGERLWPACMMSHSDKRKTRGHCQEGLDSGFDHQEILICL